MIYINYYLNMASPVGPAGFCCDCCSRHDKRISRFIAPRRYVDSQELFRNCHPIICWHFSSIHKELTFRGQETGSPSFCAGWSHLLSPANEFNVLSFHNVTKCPSRNTCWTLATIGQSVQGLLRGDNGRECQEKLPAVIRTTWRSLWSRHPPGAHAGFFCGSLSWSSPADQ